MEIELQIYWKPCEKNCSEGYVASYFAHFHLTVENLDFFLWAQSLTSTNLGTSGIVASKFNCCAELRPSSRFTFPLMKRAHKKTFHATSQGDLTVCFLGGFLYARPLYCSTTVHQTLKSLIFMGRSKLLKINIIVMGFFFFPTLDPTAKLILKKISISSTILHVYSCDSTLLA